MSELSHSWGCCSVEAIKAESIGNRMSLRIFGHSALGRPMYLVTINALETPDQRRDFERWSKLRRLALDDPEKAIGDLGGYGDDVKVPIFIQSAIHGNEYEGVDASMQLIERLATTPRRASRAGNAVVAHGPNASGSARVTVFAMNPTYPSRS